MSAISERLRFKISDRAKSEFEFYRDSDLEWPYWPHFRFHPETEQQPQPKGTPPGQPTPI